MSNSATYSPVFGSLADRVCRFFVANPDDELSYADIVLKFEVASNSVASLLSTAIQHQLLVKQRDGGNAVVAPGPALKSWNPAIPGTSQIGRSSASVDTGEKPPAKKRRASTPLPQLDWDKVEIRSDVAKPAPRSATGGRYAALIERIKPGQMAELPFDIGKRVYDAAKKIGANATPPQKWSTRKMSETTVGIWRDA